MTENAYSNLKTQPETVAHLYHVHTSISCRHVDNIREKLTVFFLSLSLLKKKINLSPSLSISLPSKLLFSTCHGQKSSIPRRIVITTSIKSFERRNGRDRSISSIPPRPRPRSSSNARTNPVDRTTSIP